MTSLKLHGFTRGIISEKLVGNLSKVVDLFIPATAKLLFSIGDLQKIIPAGIKDIVVDFTHEAKQLRLVDYKFFSKYYKQYQSKDRFLFIVLTHLSITIAEVDFFTKDLNQKSPAFAQNIKIILLDNFLKTLSVSQKSFFLSFNNIFYCV